MWNKQWKSKKERKEVWKQVNWDGKSNGPLPPPPPQTNENNVNESEKIRKG